MRRRHCIPGAMCFECPYPDCTMGGEKTREETLMKRAGNPVRVGFAIDAETQYGGGRNARGNDGTHSLVRGRYSPIFSGDGLCKTTKASPAEIEQMLAVYGNKLEPIKGVRHRTPAKK